MIPLGSTVTDRITGFSGVVTGYVQYITGCNQALVSPKVGKDGAIRDSHWFDESRLVVAKTKPIKLPVDTKASVGFDRAPPKI